MKGYLVTVQGDYFGSATEFDRKRQKFPYEIEVVVNSPDRALSIIKNKLLGRALRRKYPNYHIWRTHQLVSITNQDGSKVHGITNIRLMDFDDLANYVRVNKLPVKLELYTDLGYFRKMVFLAETNQHEFRIKQATLEKDCEEERQLRELNPDLYDTATPVPKVTPEERYATPVSKVTPEERYGRSVQLDSVHKTTIIEGENPVVKATKTHSAANIPVAENSPSVLITEDKPAGQKVEKVFDGKTERFVNPAESDDFVENFTKPEEEEFEVYDPTKSASVEDL